MVLQAQIHKIELTVHTNELHARITASQLVYLHRMEEENLAWALRVEREERERRKVNRMMRLAAQGTQEASTNPQGTHMHVINCINIRLKSIQATRR